MTRISCEVKTRIEIEHSIKSKRRFCYLKITRTAHTKVCMNSCNLPSQTSEGRRSSPEPPELPFFKDEPPAPGLRGNEVISFDEEMTECRRVVFFGGGGTIKPDREILVVNWGPEVGMLSGGLCICSHSRRTEPSLVKATLDISAAIRGSNLSILLSTIREF